MSELLVELLALDMSLILLYVFYRIWDGLKEEVLERHQVDPKYFNHWDGHVRELGEIYQDLMSSMKK